MELLEDIVKLSESSSTDEASSVTATSVTYSDVFFDNVI